MIRSRITFIAAALLIVSMGWMLSAAGQTTAPTQKVRIGIYDSRALAVASRNSATFTAPIAELQRQLKAAQAAGDTKRVDQIKQRGAALQTQRHLQAFGNAPVDDLIVHIQGQLPQIAQAAGVVAIVSRLEYAGADVETVDVTDQLVQAFDPDAKTLEVVKSLRAHKPEAMVDLLLLKD